MAEAPLISLRLTMVHGLPPSEDRFRHKPLPSVDIALLPEDVRAARVQRVAVFATAGIGLLVVLGVAVGPWAAKRFGAEKAEPDPMATAPSHERVDLPASQAAGPPAAATTQLAAPAAAGPSPRSMTAPPTADPSAPAEDVPPLAAVQETFAAPDVLSRAERKFGSAPSFRAALTGAGASPDEADDIITALTKHIDFRHGRPEDMLVFERNAAGTLRAFEYRVNLTEVYRVQREKDGKLKGQRVRIDVEKRRIAKGIQVAGSLGHSLAALGLGPALAGAVIEAFDTKVSFRKDTRTGDSVKLILDEEYVEGNFLRYGNVLAVEYTGEKHGKLQAFWYEPPRSRGEFYEPSGRAVHGGWLRTPLRYDHISSPFNPRRRHPILKRIMPHQGVDYSAGTGTPVWAAADGTVSFAGPRGANGNLVSLKHKGGYETHYAHLWRIAPGMKSGVRVSQRQLIGYVGTTGRSTGPHLHFALKRSGRFVDPVLQLNGPGQPLPTSLMPHFRAHTQRLRAELDRIQVASAPQAPNAPEPENEHIEDEEDL